MKTKHCLSLASFLGVLLLTSAFRWEGILEENAHLQACAGDGLSFRWFLQLEKNESIVDVEWLFEGTGKANVSVAGLLDQSFLTNKDKFQLLPNVGLAIENVDVDDTGVYYVRVKLSDVSCEKLLITERKVVLTVAGTAPVTTDGELHVRARPVTTNKTLLSAESHVQLVCGHFTSLGHPQVAPVWTTPSGDVMNSSQENNGMFVLLLTNPVEIGNYTCQIPSTSPAIQCLPSASPLAVPAHLYLDEKDVRLLVLEVRQQELAEQVEKLVEQNDRQAEEIQKLEEKNRDLATTVEEISRKVEDHFLEPHNNSEAGQTSRPSCSNGVSWSKIEGYLFRSVSVGPAGVWGVTSHYGIYYRQGTYGNVSNQGQRWVKVEGHLKQIDVGTDVFWGVNYDDYVFYRSGISASRPQGTGWVNLGGGVKHVTVTPNGHVWGVSTQGKVLFREGASNRNRTGRGWVEVDGIKLKQISAGPSGVWGVDVNNDLYYRIGTSGDNGSRGSTWHVVDKGVLKYVSSGDGYVVGVDRSDQIWRREGVTADWTGHSWVKLTGALKVIDMAEGCYVWGVNSGGQIWVSTM